MFLAKSTHQKVSICHIFSVGTIAVRHKQTWKVISSTQTDTHCQVNYCNPSRMRRGLIILTSFLTRDYNIPWQVAMMHVNNTF